MQKTSTRSLRMRIFLVRFNVQTMHNRSVFAILKEVWPLYGQEFIQAVQVLQIEVKQSNTKRQICVFVSLYGHTFVF